MTDHYRIRVVPQGEVRPPDHIFENLVDDVVYLISALGVPPGKIPEAPLGPETPKGLSHPLLDPAMRALYGETTTLRDAMHAASAALIPLGEHGAVEFLAREFDYDPKIVEMIGIDATQLSSDTLRDLTPTLLAHRLLEDAFPQSVRCVRGAKLRLEVLQLHSDYPPVLPPEGELSSEEVESFCLRVLCEATSLGARESGSRLIQHFEKYAPYGWADEDFGAPEATCDVPGIIWSAQLVEINEDADEPGPHWWSTDPVAKELRRVRAEEKVSSIDCSLLGIYEVVIHPHWMAQLTTEKTFDSAAYG